MRYGLTSVWKEVIVAYFEVLSHMSEGEQRKIGHPVYRHSLEPRTYRNEVGVVFTRPQCSTGDLISENEWI
jgi:hypothetical protein